MFSSNRALKLGLAIVVIFSVFASFGIFPATAGPVGSYRWRNDDGAESTATFLSDENTALGRIAKNSSVRLRLSAGNDGSQSELLRQAAKELMPAETSYPLDAYVIDALNGYAYLGTRNTNPSKIIKMALGSGSNPPAYVGSLTLNTGESNFYSAVIDVANGYAYFGTGNTPAQVVKIALGIGDAPPTRIGALTLNSGENDLKTAIIDTASGYAYFGTNTSPGQVVKVALGSGDALPTRVGALALNSGENLLYSAVADTASGYAYFGTNTSPGQVVKVALGSGDALPTRVGALALNAGESALKSSFIDTANGYAYFVGATSPGQVIKISLGVGSDLPTRIGSVALNSGEAVTSAAVIDIANGSMYLGTTSTPAKVVKVALGVGASLPTRIGSIALNSKEGTLGSAFVDASNGYAYFNGSSMMDGIFTTKIKLNAGALDLPSRVGSIRFLYNSGNVLASAVDAVNGYAYVSTASYPSHVIKLALGSGSGAPARIGSIELAEGEDIAGVAVIDTAHGYAYFGTNTSPGRVVKVALGSGSSSPARIGAVTLSTGENLLKSAVIDVANGYAYFGTGTSPGRVVKVALGSGDALPTRVGALTLGSGENLPYSAVADTASGYAYFGTNTSPGQVVKVALGSGDALPTRVGAITLNADDGNLRSSVIDAAKGYVYFGAVNSSTLPQTFVKVSIAPRPRFRLEYGEKVTACSAVASWTQVPSVATGEVWQMATSSNLTDGSATTNVAGALADSNTLFRSGQVLTASSQASAIALDERSFTELEYSIKATDNAVAGHTYCFRLSDAGTATDFFSQNYPEATVATAVSAHRETYVPPKPSLEVTSPNGGGVLVGGSTIGVSWNTANGSFIKYRISYSDDSGTTWRVLADNFVSNSYSWNVPKAATVAGLVKIEGFDSSNEILAFDESDSVFAVKGLAPVPAEGEISKTSSSGSSITGAAIFENYDPENEKASSPDVNTDLGLVRNPSSDPKCVSNTLIKGSLPAVYYCGADGKRYVFVNDRVYSTWYADFSKVKKISDTMLAKIEIGGNVTYRPGTRMVKVQSDPRVYAVAHNGVLRPVTSEVSAARIYGADWNRLVHDIPDASFADYDLGNRLE